MRIGGFIKTTLSDWDGKVACMAFVPGCNFSCPFCHNPEMAHGNEETVNKKEVLDYIRNNNDFLDGFVISGGEPTLNKDLYVFLKEIKRLGVDIKIDTNGSFPDVLDDLIGAKLVDYVAMDIKSPLVPEKYSVATGGYEDVTKIKESIRIIMDSGIDYEFRTTVFPEAVSIEDVVEIAKSIMGAKRYCIQQFRPGITMDPEAGKVKPYSQKQLREMHDAVKPFVKKVVMRGT